jgi:hypothetical protein
MEEKNKQFFINDKLASIKLDNNLFLDRKSKMDPSRQLIIKSLEIIKSQWNMDIKSRNFIKHLISNFIPIELNNKIISFKYENDLEKKENIKKSNKCAILGLRLVGFKDLFEKIEDLTPIASRIKELQSLESPGISDTEELSVKLNELNDKINSFPIEYREYSIAYYSLNSDKLLSIHALYALNHFVEQALLIGDKDIHFTITKVRLKDNQIIKNSKISQTEINSLAKATSYGVKNNHLSEKTYNALEKLKLQLKD